MERIQWLVLAALFAASAQVSANKPPPAEQAMAGAAATSVAQTCFVDGWAESLRCYQVPVPGEGGEGQAETLSVLVAPAVNAGDREPLYLLAGGPGQAASDLAPLLNAFRKINRERAMVLVDRRGAGRSNAFDCGFGHNIPVNPQVFIQKLSDCYAQQPQRTLSLNSRQAVADLEVVRRFLGHQKISLWGGSWGTRTALLYQQWHPQSIASLILDGVAPIGTKVFLSAAAAEQALNQLQQDCAQDAVCAGFGDWRAELSQLLANWSDAQARNFPDPMTGLPTVEPLSSWMLAGAVRAALYDPAAAAQLPFAVHQATRGNYLPLSGIAGLFAAQGDSMSMGLTFSVACAEEIPRISSDEIATDSSGTFIGDGFIRPFVDGCKVWPVPAQPYSAPEPRAQPVLLISGSADPITPPQYAEQQLGYLQHKQHVIVQGGGHINSPRGCIPGLIAEFLDAPQKPLDSSCADDIQRPPFMADAFGPALSGSAYPNSYPNSYPKLEREQP